MTILFGICFVLYTSSHIKLIKQVNENLLEDNELERHRYHRDKYSSQSYEAWKVEICHFNNKTSTVLLQLVVYTHITKSRVISFDGIKTKRDSPICKCAVYYL